MFAPDSEEEDDDSRDNSALGGYNRHNRNEDDDVIMGGGSSDEDNAERSQQVGRGGAAAAAARGGGMVLGGGGRIGMKGQVLAAAQAASMSMCEFDDCLLAKVLLESLTWKVTVQLHAGGGLQHLEVRWWRRRLAFGPVLPNHLQPIYAPRRMCESGCLAEHDTAALIQRHFCLPRCGMATP